MFKTGEIMFDILVLLFWIIVIHGIPGALAGLGIFRKTKFTTFERMFTGFGLFLFITPTISFLLYLLFGIKFTYAISVISIVLAYLIGICIFLYYYYKDGKFDLKLSEIPKKLIAEYSNYTKLTTTVLLIILLFVTFWIRAMSYGPVHFELDPYYYIYIGEQVITMGYNPVSDATAWYPMKVNHRGNPSMAYMDAMWYTQYVGHTGAKYFNKYLYATITSVYPGLAAMFAVFFLYLLITTVYLYHKHDWSRWLGLLIAAIASFMPVFYIKLTAGEMEAQPYAFYALSMFFSLMLIAMLYKKWKFAIAAGLGASAVTLGSSSGSFATAVFLIYPYLLAGLEILRVLVGKIVTAKEYKKERTKIFEKNVIIFSIAYAFALIARMIMDYFRGGNIHLIGTLLNISISYAPILIVYILLLFLDYKNNNIDHEWIKNAFKPYKNISFTNAIIGLTVIGILIIGLTPIGGALVHIVKGGLGITQYNMALSRTIAEQPPTGASFEGNLGYIAKTVSSTKSKTGGLTGIMNAIEYPIVAPLSTIADSIIKFTYDTFDTTLGMHINYTNKTPNILYMFILLFGIALTYMGYESIVEEKTRGIMLLLVMIFPPMMLGIMKVKYTIYLGFFFMIGLGLVFGETIRAVIKRVKDVSWHLATKYSMLLILLLLVVFQYTNSFYPSLVANMFKQQFDQNPGAFKTKFTNIANQINRYGGDNYLCAHGYPCSVYDSPISVVAADPIAYANESVTNKYSEKYCMISLIDNPLQPRKDEIIDAQLRCQFINNYWLDAMDWISKNVDDNDYVTSWWDYGHWTNYFGQKDTLLRNEHLSHEMIQAVAYLYTRGTPEELKAYMIKHHSKYALFDVESSGILGGKWGALNYLGCVYTHNTSVAKSPGMSDCERNNLWETIYIPEKPSKEDICQISKYPNKTGITVYEPKAQNINGRMINVFMPMYCLGKTKTTKGEVNALYYLNKKYKNGDLKLNRADIMILTKQNIVTKSGQRGMYIGATLYTKDKKWIVNGNATSGWDDRIGKGGFYNSNFYKAFYLKQLPGFDLVFTSRDNKIKIFKIHEE